LADLQGSRAMATHEAPKQQPQIRSVEDMPADTRRGGDVRTLLSPKTAGSTSGFMGVATLQAGDRISEHYHPYSEEFVYLVRGAIDAQLEGESHPLRAGQGLLIPINVRHRLVNDSDDEAFLVFHLGPLAPDPKLGHVDTE
jgi:putative monooxygenase